MSSIETPDPPRSPAFASPAFGVEGPLSTLEPIRSQSVRDLMRRVTRHRVLLASVMLAVVAPVTLWAFLATPRYRSEARLRIQSQNSPGSAFADQIASIPGAGMLGIGRDELETEIGVLQSDRIADAMIDSLALGVRVAKPPGNRARILAARVLDRAGDVSGSMKLTRDGADRYAVVKQKFDTVVSLPTSLRLGVPFRVGPFEIALNPDLRANGPKDIVVQFLPRYAVHGLLTKRLSIVRQQGGSRLVEVSFEDPDRVLAAQVVAQLVGNYVAYSTNTDRTEDVTTAAQLRLQVDSTARQLANAEMTLRQFEERSRLIAPEDQASAQVKRVSAISAQVDALSVERNALARMLKIIGDRSRDGADPSAYRQLATFPSLITNRAIQDLLQTLVDLENKRSALGVTRTNENPEYKQLTNRIAEIERQLYQIGPQYLESLDQQLATSAHTVTALTDTLEGIPGAAMQYGRLVRQRTLLETTYLALQKQLKQVELRDALRQQQVRVVDAPRVSSRENPVFPNKPVMIVLGIVLGAVLAFAVALAAELWREPVYT